jgi:cell division protein FtsZ
MEGKVRVLAIMTGVQNHQLLGNRQSYKSVLEDLEQKKAAPKAPVMPNRKSRDFTSGGPQLEWVG